VAKPSRSTLITSRIPLELTQLRLVEDDTAALPNFQTATKMQPDVHNNAGKSPDLKGASARLPDLSA